MTPEQREAVVTTEGPLLILAGAGTGKTRVIVHRIAYLLQTIPGLTPSNLLPLAFSRKAAAQMQERVEALLGSLSAPLEISTFHGFCHRFLQDHASQLGLASHFELLDSLESWIFLRRLLPELKLKSYLEVAAPTAPLSDFLRFISRAKDELVFPTDYAAYVKTISDPQKRLRAQEMERVYRLYQTRMRQAGKIDFGDLIVETYRAFKTHSALLKEFQERYRYLLVDEFQDTNVAQIQLLKLLSGEARNICVVGDDDQAIYRFRGASFASFLLFHQAFPNARTIRLTRNYRSTQKILSVSERLIRHNEPDRFDPEKALWTQVTEGPPVEVVTCCNDVSEAQQVVGIIQRIQQETPELPLHQIAILYRAHAHRDQVMNALAQAGIPFVVDKGMGFLRHPLIQDLLAVLRVLQDPIDSVSLFRVLSHPVWGIPLGELTRLTRRSKEKNCSLSQTLLQGLDDLALTSESKLHLEKLLKELDFFQRKASRQPVDRLIFDLVQESSFRTMIWAQGLSAQEPWRQLGRFLRYVERYGKTHPEALDLASFLWYVDSTMLSGLTLPDEDTPITENRVNLMTIHQAKGLEFDWVILLGLLQGKFPSRPHPEPVLFPEELMKEKLPQGDFHLQEERRLCYVAFTRAKKGLFLMTQERNYHRSSIFIRQIREGISSGELREVQAEALPDSENLLGSQTSHGGSSWALERQALELFQQIRQGSGREDEAEFSKILETLTQVAHRLRQQTQSQWRFQEKLELSAGQQFSFTQLETYRTCPMKYKFGYLYAIPVLPTPEMLFGIDLHKCLEKFFIFFLEGKTPTLEQLLESFQNVYHPGRYGEEVQDQEYQRLGVQILTDFYHQPPSDFGTPLFVEKAFQLPLGGVVIRGVIDRIDPLPGGGVEIVDYKTGKPKEKADADQQLQLRLYALAVREVLGLVPQRITFYYLRNNQKLSYEQKPEDFKPTQERVLEWVEKIRSGNFDPDPSIVKCRRCDFRKLCPAAMI